MFLIILGVIVDAILLWLTVTDYPQLLGAFIVVGCGVFNLWMLRGTRKVAKG